MLEGIRAALLGRRVACPLDLEDLLPADEVTLREGTVVTRIGGVLGRMGRPAAAVTLGRTIVIHRGTRLTPGLLRHELAHVRQWREDALFPLKYAVATLRHGYHDNPYEVEAREFARAPSRDPADAAKERTV